MLYLATQIVADYPPDTRPGTGLLLNARILDFASPVASVATRSGQIAQIRYQLEHGDTDEGTRALLGD